jgi:ech hydrogenase subunit F
MSLTMLHPMVLISLRNLFSRPASERPGDHPAPAAGSRGALQIEIKDCVFCGLCARKCPADAFTVDLKKRLLAFEELKCVSCGACVDACSKHCLSLTEELPATRLHCEGPLRVEHHTEAPPKARPKEEATPTPAAA